MKNISKSKLKKHIKQSFKEPTKNLFKDVNRPSKKHKSSHSGTISASQNLDFDHSFAPESQKKPSSKFMLSETFGFSPKYTKKSVKNSDSACEQPSPEGSVKVCQLQAGFDDELLLPFKKQSDKLWRNLINAQRPSPNATSREFRQYYRDKTRLYEAALHDCPESLDLAIDFLEYRADTKIDSKELRKLWHVMINQYPTIPRIYSAFFNFILLRKGLGALNKATSLDFEDCVVSVKYGFETFLSTFALDGADGDVNSHFTTMVFLWCRFLVSHGDTEIAISVAQALFEYTLDRRLIENCKQSASNEWLMQEFAQYWQHEYPRVGESTPEESSGWFAFYSKKTKLPNDTISMGQMIQIEMLSTSQKPCAVILKKCPVPQPVKIVETFTNPESRYNTYDRENDAFSLFISHEMHLDRQQVLPLRVSDHPSEASNFPERVSLLEDISYLLFPLHDEASIEIFLMHYFNFIGLQFQFVFHERHIVSQQDFLMSNHFVPDMQLYEHLSENIPHEVQFILHVLLGSVAMVRMKPDVFQNPDRQKIIRDSFYRIFDRYPEKVNFAIAYLQFEMLLCLCDNETPMNFRGVLKVAHLLCFNDTISSNIDMFRIIAGLEYIVNGSIASSEFVMSQGKAHDWFSVQIIAWGIGDKSLAYENLVSVYQASENVSQILQTEIEKMFSLMKNAALDKESTPSLIVPSYSAYSFVNLCATYVMYEFLKPHSGSISMSTKALIKFVSAFSSWFKQCEDTGTFELWSEDCNFAWKWLCHFFVLLESASNDGLLLNDIELVFHFPMSPALNFLSRNLEWSSQVLERQFSHRVLMQKLMLESRALNSKYEKENGYPFILLDTSCDLILNLDDDRRKNDKSDEYVSLVKTFKNLVFLFPYCCSILRLYCRFDMLVDRTQTTMKQHLFRWQKFCKMFALDYLHLWRPVRYCESDHEDESAALALLPQQHIFCRQWNNTTAK